MKFLKENWIYFVLLIAFSLTFIPVLDLPFSNLDDYVQVVENPFLKQLNFAAIIGIFSNTFVGMYQPITTTAYLLIAQIHGIDPFWFHFASLVTHLINGILVYNVLRHFCKKETAQILSILFIVHPLQVESVAWVSAYSNLLFSSFSLLSIDAYIKHCKTQKKPPYWRSLLFFLFATLAKSSAISLVLVLPLLNLYFLGKITLKKLFGHIPFALVGLFFGIITLLSRESAGHLSELSQRFDLIDRTIIVTRNLLYYPVKFVWPNSLSIFYPFPESGIGLPWNYYLSIPLLSLVAYLVFKYRSNNKIWFGVLFYLCTIVLVVQIIPLGNQLTTDRYLYLPMVGLFILVSFLIDKHFGKKHVRLLIALPILFSFLSFQRLQLWRNDGLLWADVLHKHPNVAQAHNNLGSYLLKQGKSKEAFVHFEKATLLNPNYADAHSNLGNWYSKNNQSGKAIEQFNIAIDLRPHADAYFNRGNEYAKFKKFELAIEDYSSSIALMAHEESYTNKAYSLIQLGKLNAAEKELTTALNLNPNYGRALFLMGILSRMNQNQTEACSYFRRAMRQGDVNAQQAFKNYCS